MYIYIYTCIYVYIYIYIHVDILWPARIDGRIAARLRLLAQERERGTEGDREAGRDGVAWPIRCSS